MHGVPVKNSSDKELCYPYDAAKQHYRALKAVKNYQFDTVLTVILQQKVDKKTQLKLSYYSNNSENIPPCTEFLKFLDLQARHLDSMWTQNTLQDQIVSCLL